MLEGKKVALAGIEPDDIEWMREQRNDPGLRRYFREWKDISKEQQLNWYNTRGNNSNQDHVFFKVLDIHPRKNKDEWKLIGCCGLSYINWRIRSAEFTVYLSMDVRGKGLGKETLIMLFDYGFKEMNLHKIWCEVYDNNDALGLYKKIGFVQEGILRDSYFGEGKYGNSIVLSVLEDEWRSIHGDLVSWKV
jgi:RimJ/RimL family protein N-acetyltransferase